MNKKNTKPDTLTQRQTRRARRLYFTAALAVVLCAVLTVPAFAAPGGGSDPLTIVNNLSDFIFSCIKAIGVIMRFISFAYGCVGIWIIEDIL